MAFLEDKHISGNRNGFAIVLDERPTETESAGVYRDTPLPFAGAVKRSISQGYAAKKREAAVSDIPAEILEMIALYQYGEGSLLHKAKNFYRQGKFMEDYADDMPWNGEFHRYFTTYHDLNVRQLRGYFTWRTHVRKGEYRPIATSLAYVYIYELLCGIGADSAEDTLHKMKAFEKGYLDSGIGDPGMRRNLRRWSLEYAVLHGFSPAVAMQYADPVILEKDQALAVLKSPRRHTDEEIFSALCVFAGKKLQKTPVYAKNERKGKHLFSKVWRYLSKHYNVDGKSIFAACFGGQKSYTWYPLANAIYFEELVLTDTDFILDECRSYHLRDGVWQEKRYEQLYFDRDRFRAVIHEADRLFRRFLKTGYYLRAKQEEAWVTPYIEAVLEAQRQEENEAAKPKIDIAFSDLDRIRREAIVTRDSLLTNEEMQECAALAAEEAKENPYKKTVEDKALFSCSAFDGLDDLHLQILAALLQGESAEERIKAEHLLPSVVADAINEALFGAIGDNILECDGERISVVEEYKEDVIEVLGGAR